MKWNERRLKEKTNTSIGETKQLVQTKIDYLCWLLIECKNREKLINQFRSAFAHTFHYQFFKFWKKSYYGFELDAIFYVVYIHSLAISLLFLYKWTSSCHVISAHTFISFEITGKKDILFNEIKLLLIILEVWDARKKACFESIGYN